MKREKKRRRTTYVKIFLPFALFSSFCILVFAVVISLIFSGSLENSYFKSDFYRIVANTVSIALIVFSISFFFSCILAYRPVRMIMNENEDLVETEKNATVELIRKFLYELCVYGKTEHELSRLTTGEDFPLDFLKPLGLSLVFIDHYRGFLQLPPPKQAELLDTVSDIFSHAFQKYYPELSIASPDRRYVMIIYNDVPAKSADRPERLLKDAQTDFFYKSGHTVTVIYSDVTSSLDKLNSLYGDCIQSIRQRLFSGWNSLIRAPLEAAESVFTQAEFSTSLKELNEQLIHGELQDAEAFLSLLKTFTGDWLGYQTALLTVRGQLEQDILILENSRKMTFLENIRETLIFDNCETMEEINGFLLQAIQFIDHEYRNADQQRQQGYIDRVEELIMENYQNCDYGVQQIASDLGLSNTYISKLYKELTGGNMIDRLTQYRMEAAVSLLVGSDIPVTDIYSLAGYSSVNYFYRVFKKYYGVTPGQYREMKGGKS